MMTAQFEEALLKVLHEIADNIEVLSYDVQNLTAATQEISNPQRSGD